jgi:hypothetical protein
VRSGWRLSAKWGRTEARQERLCAFRNPEAARASQEVSLGDAALAFTRGLMAIFGTIV